MDIQEELLEPLKLYNYDLKQKHQENVNAYFDELSEKSGVDIEGNRATCADYYSLKREEENLSGKLGGQKGLRGFLIFLTIFFFVAGTILLIATIAQVFKYPAIGYSVGPIAILAGIAFIILNSTVIAKKLSLLSGKKEIVTKKAKEKLDLANEQMVPLNALFDWNIPSSLVTKTTPIIQMDKYFTVDRYCHMVEKYGMKPCNEDNVSTLFVQSGTLVDNPFVYERDYIQHMVNRTYTGSIVITWVTYSRDSKGNSYPVTHTQTLTATISRPAADFFTDTALIYANEAAPRLSFSRRSSNANSMDEKDIEKLVKSWDKKLAKMQQDKIKSSFTPLGNTKFEALFNALDRDNEVEFRLLFTPLAQKNMISLITSKTPYGDDFSFTKRKMINVIRSNHAQHMSFDGNPYHFFGFDYDKIKSNFVEYNMNYFQGIFYDFAPLLSIPLYQQHRAFNYKYDGHHESRITHYETEVLCNFMDESVFMPEDCDTNLILKAHFSCRQGDLDIFNIHSYGFTKVPRVEYVSKLGGDGHLHSIPVHWYEYIEVSKDTPVAILNVGGTKQDYVCNISRIQEILCRSNDIIYQRGLLAFPLNDGSSIINSKDLIKLFSHKED